jgi:hypothetical protein
MRVKQPVEPWAEDVHCQPKVQVAKAAQREARPGDTEKELGRPPGGGQWRHSKGTQQPWATPRVPSHVTIQLMSPEQLRVELERCDRRK